MSIGDMMRVAVIDGQGGGIGRLITEQLRKAFLKLKSLPWELILLLHL